MTKGNNSARRRTAPPPPPTRPWGLIAGTVAVVLFAAGVIGYGVYRVQDAGARSPEALAAAAADIDGIAKKDFPSRNHQQGDVTYKESPPFGGVHDGEWADCTGTIYPAAIRKENAVHSLEHGAVWITYRPDLPADQVTALRGKVDAAEYRMMSPYPGLDAAVSLQSWGHQLKVGSATDPRVDEFLTKLSQNATTTPEYGASCSNPRFKANPRPPTASGGAG